MAWKMDNPLYSLSDEQEQQQVLKMWGEERMGGLIHPGNNRLPFPLTFLIALIVLTAFMLTMPIWGQRPTAAIYQAHVELMNSPEVQKLATAEEKMKYINTEAYNRAPDNALKGQLERHPIDWYDLQNLAPHIIELQKQTKYPLDNFTVLGDTVVLANFEGNFRADGVRERKQPWWDKGYTIDVFYVIYFFLWMFIMIKRLPHFSKKPGTA